MPRIHPEGWRQIPASGALARKLATLAELEDGLPDSFTVFHGVHWTRAEHEHLLFGAIDFAIVGPSGRVLLVEQVAGFLDETPEGLVKRHIRTRLNVSVELARTADHLRARLKPCLDGMEPALDLLLYCPDFMVRDPGSAGLDPGRIIDAARREQLVTTIRMLLDSEAAEPAVVARIDRFFADELELAPDPSALVGQATTLYTRLAGGLAEWGRRIEMQPHRLRVTGTAGSGKTQLALAVLGDAVAAGRRALYVCYNRPLADHIARIAPPGAEVTTYHQLCDRMLSAAGKPPSFSGHDAFTRLERDFAELPVAPRYDELIVDEGQDFAEAWRDALLRLLAPEGRAWWLEDPMQNLYERPEVALPGWVRLSSGRNFRSPSDIVALLNRRLALPQPMQAGSPLAGSEVEVSVWANEAELMERTRRAITRAIGLGFRREHIALVTFRGRENSRFTGLERLAQHTLRAFTGRYDLVGSPEYTTGDFLIDSVHRFKGQAAPCVIFTEIDFDALDTRTQRKLFVGATRAGMKLMMVMSKRAAGLLELDASETPTG
ncbi:MAG: ATP-binding domain-containing protein [Thauera sp.]|nr:ATP-binding domain-containing protein [Thauera sp.]